jgi:hypothetical protein
MHIVPIQGWDVEAATFLHTNPGSSRISLTASGSYANRQCMPPWRKGQAVAARGAG